MTGLVNLQTYSRPALLEKCLRSIASLNGIDEMPKIIVLQIGNLEVENLVEKFAQENSMTTVLRVDGSLKSPLQNMNHNRWIAWKLGFTDYKVDWIFSIEEDVVVHPNSLDFIKSVYAQHKGDKKFRGINLGSKMVGEGLSCSFSRIRYGLHGCAGVVTRETWELMKKNKVERKIQNVALDACIEHLLKTGYMVTPNQSYYLDYGWYQGTHTNGDSTNPHYKSVELSYQANTQTCHDFRLNQLQHNWREDAIPYRKRDDLKFFILYPLQKARMTKLYLGFYGRLKKMNAKRKQIFSIYKP